MSKKQKLIDKLKTKPKDLTIDEAESLLLSLGFIKSNKGRTSGSRVEFKHGRLKIRLHAPHPCKDLKPYQVNMIKDALERGAFI